MTVSNNLATLALGVVVGLTFVATPSVAQTVDLSFGELGRGNGKGNGGGGGGGGGGGSSLPTLYDWMSPEIAEAWSQGFQGQGSRITVVDDFSSNWGYYGDLGTGTQLLRHGEWVMLEAEMIAPSARFEAHDFYSGRSVGLRRRHLNTLNLSYGMYAADGYSSVRWGQQENSIISYAVNGDAVVVKAAGNDGVAVGAANQDGLVDYLNRDLIGAQSAVFVGALDRNGTTDNLAQMAWYSNIAGSNATIQEQFISVGVRGDLTGLYGTSFAAPIVSGYAAVIGSKFTSASPTQIVNQLLDTARTDTIFGYDPSVHGQGEASIARALAPVSIQ